MSLVMELDETKNGRKGEEQEHRVEQDEPGDAQPTDI